MQTPVVWKKGRFKGALFSLIAHRFFCFFAIPLLFISGVLPAAAANCAADHLDEYVSVAHVYDGDTVKLTDGRKIRLIGINTPEIGRRGDPSEPYADDARIALQKILQGRRVALRYDKDRHDRYGRVLAHLFIDQEQSVEVQLLERGLGTVLTVPPNVWNVDCYVAAERRAQASQSKLWSSPPLDSGSLTNLSADFSGYRVVSGRILRTERDKGAFLLRLKGGVTVYISPRDLAYFDGSWPKRIQGATLSVKGWLRYQGGEWRIQARHPTALQFINE